MPDDARFQKALADVVGETHLLGANRLALLDPGVDPDNFAAGLAARPGTAREVADILTLCAQAGVSVVSQGGRTGLARAAVSAPGQLVLMSDRLDQLDIDPDERIATVGAGVTLQALQDAAAIHGLSPGIDLAARGSATIGGMISTNAGGMEAFRFGMMRQRVLGMEAVLANGDVLCDLARVPKNNEGYDLRQLFCGAEGTLGVVTRVTLRLENADPPAQTVMIACEGAAAAARVMRACQSAGTLLLAEIMWRRYAHGVARACGLDGLIGFCDAPAYAIFSMAGDAQDAAAILAPLMDDGTITDAVLAKNDRESADIWRIREDSFAVNRDAAEVLWFDVSVPVSALDGYLTALTGRLEAIDPDLRLYAMGHLADGNLHLTVTRETPCPSPTREAACRAVEQGLKAMGGSISAEHGIGLSKLAALARNASPEKLALMRTLKTALDPQGLLNPGKVVP